MEPAPACWPIGFAAGAGQPFCPAHNLSEVGTGVAKVSSFRTETPRTVKLGRNDWRMAGWKPGEGTGAGRGFGVREVIFDLFPTWTPVLQDKKTRSRDSQTS
jgi:hypothetical protein